LLGLLLTLVLGLGVLGFGGKNDGHAFWRGGLGGNLFTFLPRAKIKIGKGINIQVSE
jgi:hypothetical protein